MIEQDLGQTVGVVEFVDIGDVTIAFFRCFGIADIVNTKTQAFGQVVKAMQFKLFQLAHPLSG